jgi:hypothetical protein
MSRLPVLAVCVTLVAVAGCSGGGDSKPQASNSDKGIIGKTTQDVGAFDPNKANQVVSDSKIHASDPVTAPLAAYGPILEQTTKLQIAHALDIFNAAEGHYPKDHAEFMERIIKENNIRLPVLPFKGKYVYDVEKHELMVVRDIENAEKAKQ